MKIPKIKNKSFIINIDIYHVKIYVIIGDINQLKTLILSDCPKPTENNLKDLDDLMLHFKEEQKVYAGYFYPLENGNMILHFKDFDSIFNYITHEVLHSVFHIMDRIGMGKQCRKNEEAYCYLNGYINKEIFKQL